MATLLHSESRRLYSWWWDSHISPKNSKWLQENLTDMDAKVKAMIKLIEEDADSFARRAEMYYKKRPELMKLVEEFYRAYRALAERYNHATVELHQAHRTMAEALPSQAQYMLPDDSPSSSAGPEAEPHTPEVSHLLRAFLEPDDLQKDSPGYSSIHNALKKNGGSSEQPNYGINRKGLKQLTDMFGLAQLSADEQNLQSQTHLEAEHAAAKAEIEIQTLKMALAKIQSEKDALVLQYQKSLEKLSDLERELNNAQTDAGGLGERASKAEIEIDILKEILVELKAERDAGLVQYDHCLEKIASLETMLSVAQHDAKGLDERASNAETEAESLRQEISRLEAEKNVRLVQYEECLKKISVLETKLSLAEENSRMLTELLERSETEVEALRKNLTELNEEKEAVAALYKQCLETIAKLESEVLHAQENSERLNREIVIGAEKLSSVEKHCDVLETSNRSLQIEADNLVQKIAMKDQELLEKHTELERLQNVLQEEHSHFLQIEAALQTLQKLHSQSQAEQNSLALELQYGLQLLKDLELSKQGFKEEMQQIVAENRTLHELNFCSTTSIKNQQREISKLKGIKEKLEREVSKKAEESNSLQQEIHQIKNEIQLLINRHQAMLKQVEAVGLDPESLAASVKDLQNENLKLKEACKNEKDEKQALYEKSKDMDKLSRENSLMESSLSRLNEELDALKCAANKFQGSCQILEGEKSVLVAEKATLLSQLQVITESMQKLLEKNTLLEKSLSGANMELQDLRDKSSSLEEVCKSLNHEKANLLNERSTLVSQLETVEMRLGVLETRFTKLEEKCSDMEKDNKSTVNQVEELCALLLAQKNEHASHKQWSDIQLANLQDVVHLLQEEHRLGKIEFEEQLDKAVNAQVEIFILQQFIDDLEQKNLTLLTECQKHVDASKFSDKVISELESENLEQQMELEFLLHEIQKLRIGIRKVYGALQIDPDGGHNRGIKLEEIPILHILDHIEGLKGSLVKSKEEEQRLLVENSVLFTLLWQLQSDGAELDSKKKIQEQEFEIMKEQYSMLQKDKLELLEMNRQFRFEVTRGEDKENILKSELGTTQADLLDLQGANLVLQQENSKVLEEKNALLKSVVGLKNTLSMAEEENSVILHEALASSNLSLVYECFGTEKVLELRSLAEDLSTLHQMNNKLKQEVEVLREKFEAKEAENVYLNESAERMDKELHQARNLNDHLGQKMTITEDVLDKKEAELLEMKQRLEAAEALNAEFWKNIEELKMEHQETRLAKENLEMQILELSEDCMNQKKEIERLNETNRSFLSEIGYLRQEIEQQRVREETLNSELLEKNQEFQLWEAEAATFYFDLQISSVSEALLENKVNELTGVCSSLEDENAAKSLEIEKMRGRVSLLESEIGGLKGQLSAYIPVITSLKEDFLSLERTALRHAKKTHAITGEPEVVVMENSLPEDACQKLKENENTVIVDGVSDLLNMRTRIRAVQNVMLEEIGRRAKEETLIANIGVESLTDVTGNSNSKVVLYPENVRKTTFDHVSQKKSENGSMMKDIPLDQVSDSPASKNRRRENSGTDDQMLELWETAEQDSCDDHSRFSEANRQSSVPTEDVITCYQSDNSGQCPNSSSEFEVEKELGVDKVELAKTIRETNRDGKRRIILERLASDAQKLTILKMTIKDLKKKTETNKRSKKDYDIECETVRRQIREAEEAVLQLVNTNEQLMKDIEEKPSSLDRETSLVLKKDGHIHRKKATEQARRVSEQIGRLQLEVQNIQYVLLKLSEEEKNRRKNRFSERTSMLLRKIIHNNDKKSGKRRTKMCFCGCSRPSTNES